MIPVQMILAAAALIAHPASAAELRPCTNQALHCTLEDVTNPSSKKLLDSTDAPFSGFNQDEPSIEPDECTTLTSLDDKSANFYVIQLGDSDYVANVDVRSHANSGKELSSASFTVEEGKTFYFSYGDELVSCTLK
jgi:hypothetical protein